MFLLIIDYIKVLSILFTFFNINWFIFKIKFLDFNNLILKLILTLFYNNFINFSIRFYYIYLKFWIYFNNS